MELILPRTHIDYLGNQVSFENKEMLTEFNNQFNIKVDTDIELGINKEQIDNLNKTSIENTEIKVNQIDAPKNVPSVSTNNFLQNIPTTEIIKLMGSK